MEENDDIVYVIQPCGHKKATGERRRALYFIFPIIHNNIQHESSGGELADGDESVGRTGKGVLVSCNMAADRCILAKCALKANAASRWRDSRLGDWSINVYL